MIYQAARQMNLFEMGLDSAGIAGGMPEELVMPMSAAEEDEPVSHRGERRADPESGIVLNGRGVCALCGEEIDEAYGLHLHHIFFGTSNRAHSDEDGLTVYLCPHCHEHGPHAVHRDRETDMILKEAGERVWLAEHPEEGVEGFIRRYGKNYL